MKQYIKRVLPVAALLLTVGMTTSCVGDLDVDPIDPNISTEYSVEGLFNKCYANMGLAGNGGANGDCDIDGIDGGTSGFVRQLFNSNELPTDEAICGWGDDGIAQFCFNTWNDSHPMLKGYYARLTTGVTYCNQYLNVASDHDAIMTAEIRFVRALHYYLLMDAFGNIPFTLTTTTKPERYTREQAYNWLEQELLEIEPSLSEPKAKKSTDSGYGRADKAADWLLLARLYLNAEVYTGTPQWEKAATYAKKVMDSDYRLNTTTATISGLGKTWTWSAYQMLFMGDNGESDAAYEAILPILADGKTTTQWCASMFLTAGCFKEDMFANPCDTILCNGISEKWGGNRARPDLLAKFFPNGDAPNVPSYEMPAAAGDDRAIFWGEGRTLDNEETGTFTSGFSVAKFINFKSDGSTGHDAQFPDIDFFLMRKAEAYLIYAEATARSNGGRTTQEGTAAINTLRSRAHATTQTTSYSLDDLCDEWSREFYFEGLRRPTLIRFGRFGGSTDYTWQWKGGTFAGANFDTHYNIFAIPSSDLTANSNLQQNPGY